MKTAILTQFALVLAALYLACPGMSRAELPVLFYDDFDDGDYIGWTVENHMGAGTAVEAPELAVTREGYAVRGTGSGYQPDWACFITHPVNVPNARVICIEMRAKSGPQWPNEADAYLLNGQDCYIVRDYGESNRTADWTSWVGGQEDQYRYGIGERAHEWHTFAWTRDYDGWWSLSIDGVVESPNFRQDLLLTSFDYVELSLHRNQSEIEWIRISGVVAPAQRNVILYDRGGDIYVAGTDGSNERQLTSGAPNDYVPSISPDGTTIAFSRDEDLYLMNHDGANQRLLVSKGDVGNNHVYDSDWTLDGEWIYFYAVSGCCSGGLYKVRPDGTGLTPVKSGYITGIRIRGTFGDRIIFNQRRSGLSYSQNVRITDLDGGNEEQVTGGGPSESSATFGTCWSPDGQRFAYNYGHQHIYVANYPAPYNPVEVKTFDSWKSHSLEWLNNNTLIWIDAYDAGPMHTINVDTLVETDLGINGQSPYVGSYSPEPTEPPVAEAGDDIVAGANETMSLDGSASYDPDGRIANYTWKRLPDGVVLYSGVEPTCDTKALGRVEEVIELTVTDDSSATATDTLRIISRTTQELRDQLAAMQSQIDQVQRQNQELQILVDEISSFPPIEQWLRRVAKLGDLDGDGEVNMTDLALLTRGWLR